MAKDEQVEMRLAGAQMNMTALIAGTMGFLKERGIDINEWTQYVGEKFEDSWSAFEGRSADEVMKHLLPLEIEPFGADVVEQEGTEQEARATVTPLPGKRVLEMFGTTPRELLQGFGITQREFSSIYDMYKAPAKAAGFRFTHQAKNGQHVITVKSAKRRAA